MAVDIKKMAIGAATLSIGDWVTTGGAGSLTDVGATQEGSMLAEATEFFDVEIEQAQGIVRSVPTKRTPTIKAKLVEADLDKLQRLLHQPTTNLTGTSPNRTLLVGEAQEAYHQIQIVSKGIQGSSGVAGTRTITVWRAVVKNIGETAYAKGGLQTRDVEIAILEDLSVTTADKLYKIVDSGAS